MDRTPHLSAEQEKLLDVVGDGHDALVDACIGSGKTTTIQQLCAEFGSEKQILYLTYSKLLKRDAMRRVGSAKVQNFHGIVYPHLKRVGLGRSGYGESIREFNDNFALMAQTFPRYDMLVIDEYQDLNEEYARLLANIRSLNPAMQVVMVGDMEQKIRTDTRLDVRGFVDQFLHQPRRVSFTRSFRMGPRMAELLSEAWNKPIVGVNEDQRMRFVDVEEATRLIAAHAPSDILCLGTRNGPMSGVLNTLEAGHSETFNKETVFASIRDGDGGSPDDSSAIFTTFDSSKGLERPLSTVFDFGLHTWDVRMDFSDTVPEILRNIFLVAASRGKDEIVFVRDDRSPDPGLDRTHTIGGIPVVTFTDLPGTRKPIYEDMLHASECFDFVYAENRQACMSLIERRRVDDGRGQEIDIERNDGLIDLSPVVGHYQEALYFEDYDAAGDVLGNPMLYGDEMAERLSEWLTGSPWNDSLVLTAFETKQMRYVQQVWKQIRPEPELALMERLVTRLPRDCTVQQQMFLRGEAVDEDSGDESWIGFEGICDAVHEDVVFELKFVSDLSEAMFLQLAMYLVMCGKETGMLWNTRTDECWEVRVPDRQRFLDGVVRCVSRQEYTRFEDAYDNLRNATAQLTRVDVDEVA